MAEKCDNSMCYVNFLDTLLISQRSWLQGVKQCHRRYCDKSMPASNAARSEKIMWIRKNRCECTKIVKVVENNHLRLETSENYKDCNCIFFWGPEPRHQGGFVPLDPP